MAGNNLMATRPNNRGPYLSECNRCVLSTLVLGLIKVNGNMNKMTPISKIPVEILTEIFLTLEDDLFNCGETYPPSWGVLCHVLPPLEVTQVCSSWRSMLLNFPPYWTKIVLGGFLDSQSWADELVRRSRGLPLDIKVIAHEVHGLNIDCAMEHIAQIRSLELDASAFFYPTEYRRGRTLIQAPLLEEVILRSYDFEDEYDDFHPGMPMSFVEDPLWRIEAPKLKRYWSGPTLTPYAISKFTGIKELEVVSQEPDEVILPSELFFRALSELRHLESLIWITPLESIHSPPSPNGRTLHLPHLRSVTLGIDPRPMLDFLDQADISPSCTIDLKINTNWIQSSHYPAVDKLARAISDWAKRLKVDEDQETTVDLKFFLKGPFVFELVHSQPQDTVTPPTKPNIRLSVEARKEISNKDPFAYVPIMLNLFCASLQYVLNEASVSKAKITWMENLDYFLCFFLISTSSPDNSIVMESVTELTVHNAHSLFFDELAGTPLCPSLQTLRITGTGTKDLIMGRDQSRSIRDYASSEKGRTLQVVDIRDLDPESTLYTSLVDAAESETQLGAKLLSRDS